MPRPFKMVKSATHTHMYNYTETHVNGQKSTKLLPQSVFLSSTHTVASRHIQLKAGTKTTGLGYNRTYIGLIIFFLFSVFLLLFG